MFLLSKACNWSQTEASKSPSEEIIAYYLAAYDDVQSMFYST